MADLTTEEILYICVGVLSAAWILLLIFVLYIFIQQRKLAKALKKTIPNALGNVRVQKAKLKTDFAYRNPTITHDEELFRRGYSMYREPDVENQSQVSGQVFVEDLQKKPQQQQQQRSNRQNSEPPPQFVIHGIENNKGKSNNNPISRGRTKSYGENPNFIY